MTKLVNLTDEAWSSEAADGSVPKTRAMLSMLVT